MVGSSKSVTYFLNEAARILKERGVERDDQQERSMQRIVDTFNTLVGGDRRLSVADGWLFMVILKLVRLEVNLNEDSATDAIAYMTLLAEELFSQDNLSKPSDGV